MRKEDGAGTGTGTEQEKVGWGGESGRLVGQEKPAQLTKV